jgi:DNA-binding transcriptional regulator YhcF (GntR family)
MTVVSEIAVDRQAEVPLGVQLAWALRSRIGEGRLLPGERLPGLRELAETVGVNLNTVRAVYQRLEQEGLLETRHGSGTYVAGTAAVLSSAGEIAAGAARAAIEQGVSPREVAAALYVSEPPAAPLRRQDARRRRATMEEIASLERVLATLESEHPGVVPPRAGPRSRGPHLLDDAELNEQRAGLMRRLAAVQNAIDHAREARSATKKPSRHKRQPVTSRPAEPAKGSSATQPRSPKGPKARPGRPAAAGT